MKLSINSSVTQSPPTILTKEQLKSIYLKIFSGEDGRIVLEDLAHMSGGSNFIRQESNYTAFNEGMRALFCTYARKPQGMMRLTILKEIYNEDSL